MPPRSKQIETTEPPLQPGDPGFLEQNGVNGPQPDDDEAPVQQDFFGYGSATTERYTFSDRATWVEVKKLNAGERKQYELMTRGDVTLDRRSGNAKLQMNPGRDRDALLSLSVVNWNLLRRGRPIPFDRTALEDFLELGPVEEIDGMYEAASKVNKWLESEMTLEDIDSEIERLTEQRAELKERQRGEGSSSSR